MNTSGRTRLVRWFDRIGSEILGWGLVLLGVVMVVAPGPGLLALVAGVWILARHNPWAERLLEPLNRKAQQAAREGVQTWPRIVASALGAFVVMAVGIVWCVDPSIPEFSIVGIDVGPDLPLGGITTGASIIVSSLVALGLLVYSVRRYRGAGTDPDARIDELEQA